jgi:hypothetical protein
MPNIHVMTLKFNLGDYPYDYELEIWKNILECRYYIREHADTTPRNFDQFLTVGQTLRFIHTGKADRNYTWQQIDFFNGIAFQKKMILDMRWEEVADSGAMLPLELNITFPDRRVKE